MSWSDLPREIQESIVQKYVEEPIVITTNVEFIKNETHPSFSVSTLILCRFWSQFHEKLKPSMTQWVQQINSCQSIVSYGFNFYAVIDTFRSDPILHIQISDFTNEILQFRFKIYLNRIALMIPPVESLYKILYNPNYDSNNPEDKYIRLNVIPIRWDVNPCVYFFHLSDGRCLNGVYMIRDFLRTGDLTDILNIQRIETVSQDFGCLLDNP